MTALDIRQISDKDLKAGSAPKARQELRVFFSERAFDRAVTRGDADLTREIGGVLVGELLRDDAGPFLRVEATIDALHAEEKGAELTFTHATWEHIHKEMDSTHDGKKIVGWYHTHPGFGIFLSDRDQFICSSFFNLPFQVALVYDPKSKEHGVFAWRDGSPARARRYWVGDREHLWDGARTAATEGPRPREDAAPRSVRGAAPAATKAPAEGARRESDKEGEGDRGGAFDMKGAVMAGIAALILGGMGGFWYGTREARATLAAYEVELQRVRAEAVRGAVNELDAQLVGIVRSTIGNEAVRRPIEQSIADLDEADKLFADAPPLGSTELETALAKLRAARERAQRIRDDRGDAQATLARLEEISRQGALSPSDVQRDLGTLRSGLGALYAELAEGAARAGDMRRAERLVTAAGGVDPGNRARYEQILHPGAPPGPPPGTPPGVQPIGPKPEKGSP